jgi:uncharacterized protein (TIGR00725 family)
MMNGKIAIIGPGKVGCSMALMLTARGYTIQAIGGRSPEKTQRNLDRLSIRAEAKAIHEAALAADVVLITVKDDAIEEVAASCRFRHGAQVIHMSGAHSSEVLAAARDTFGCSVASMHVLQTFASVEQACQVLPGSTCFIEGDETACQTAETLAAALEFPVLRIRPADKVLYHAAAVLGCNGLTALLHAVVDVAREAGIPADRVLPAFAPLLRATLENNLKNGPSNALTGPIARGDAKTLAMHRKALSKLPRLDRLYQALGTYTVEHMLPDDIPNEFRRFLSCVFAAPPTRRNIIVGVMGSGNDPTREFAEPLGCWLAQQGYDLLTGGGSGVMEVVSRAFFHVPERAGRILGVLPAVPDGDSFSPPPGYPNRWVELPIRTHLTARGEQGGAVDSRNHINILSSDIIIALPGSFGTASEVKLAQRYRKPVIAFVKQRSDIPGLSNEVPNTDTLEQVTRFILDKSAALH